MPAQKIKNYFRNPRNKFDYSRNAFNYSRTHSTNLLTGAIVPVGYLNCMPGDTVPNKFGFVLQSAPILGPSLDNVYIDIIAAWCPTRLVMADFNEWLGDNDTYAWTLGNNVHFPKITQLYTGTDSYGNVMSATYYAEHYLAPHIGCRFFNTTVGGNNYINFSTVLSNDSPFYEGLSVIPSRMYDLIWNTMFRNENLQNPILFSKQSGTNLTLDFNNYKEGLGQLHFANRLKDVFTLARVAPSIQSIDIGLGKDLPVYSSSVLHSLSSNPLTGYINGSGANNVHVRLSNDTGDGQTPEHFDPQFISNYNYNAGFKPDNLWADLSTLTVNSLYYSIMLQKYMNKASSGRRPVEFYKTMFGISRSDAAHEDPELLCQQRFKVNISRVVATGNSTDGQGNMQGLGTQGAFSVTSVGGTLYPEFTATEYGMVFVFAVIRTQESYAKGIDKYLTDHELLSTYLPVFDHIGEEAVEELELTDNLPASPARNIFGYQEAWYRYRYAVNDVCGAFRPGEAMDYMTFARSLSSAQLTAGSSSFTVQDPGQFDRLLQLPVFYGTPGATGFDSKGESYTSKRYQWLIQFALAGDFIRTMSKDSEPLLFGSKL